MKGRGLIERKQKNVFCKNIKKKLTPEKDNTWYDIFSANPKNPAEARNVRRTGGGRGLRGGVRKKSGWGVSWTTSDLLISSLTSERLQPRTRGNGARRRSKARGRTFQGEWVAAEKVRAGIRHAVVVCLVCLNMTGRTKERIAQSKRARAGSLAIVD